LLERGIKLNIATLAATTSTSVVISLNPLFSDENETAIEERKKDP